MPEPLAACLMTVLCVGLYFGIISSAAARRGKWRRFTTPRRAAHTAALFLLPFFLLVGPW